MKNKLTVQELIDILNNVENKNATVVAYVSEPWGEGVASEIVEVTEEWDKLYLRDMYTKKKKVKIFT
jgi:hypothetical protein